MSRYAVSSHTQVSWVDGQIEIGSRRSRQYVRTTDPDVLALLNAFSRPATVDEAVRRFPGVEAADLASVVEGLKAIGALVPEPVRAAEEAAGARPAEASAGSTARVVSWETFHRQLVERRERLGSLHYDDLGMTVSNCGKEQLSKGCQACKEGTWFCFYPGFHCNAHCTFCPQPAELRNRDEKPIGMAFVDETLAYVDEVADKIAGLSVSGGESLMYFDVALKVLRHVSERHPWIYTWAYTNGILATPERMQALHDAGLRELRFDLAARDYHPRILDRIASHAVRIFPWVTVEVPSIASTHRFLVEEDGLARLADMGVAQINLAELCVPQGSTTSPVYQHYFSSPDSTVYCFDGFKPGSGGEYYFAESRLLTYDILEHAEKTGVDIRINDCSSEAKEVQRMARHLNWGADVVTMKRRSYPRMAPPADLLSPPAEATRNPSGVTWRTLRPGTGTVRPGPHDHVRVHYTGWTEDGNMFDSSVLRQEPMTIWLHDAIAGWADGVRTMVAGEHRRLWIPARLAYGGQAGRPQGNLVFDIELLEIL